MIALIFLTKESTFCLAGLISSFSLYLRMLKPKKSNPLGGLVPLCIAVHSGTDLPDSYPAPPSELQTVG
jgi:hypothetical protein